MTKVVNLRTYKGTDYVLCDRRSPFGNPYKIGEDGDRAEVIEKFNHYFFGRLRLDRLFRMQVYDLKDQKLGCWCNPLPCHCHTIKHFLDTAFSKEMVAARKKIFLKFIESKEKGVLHDGHP